MLGVLLRSLILTWIKTSLFGSMPVRCTIWNTLRILIHFIRRMRSSKVITLLLLTAWILFLLHSYWTCRCISIVLYRIKSSSRSVTTFIRSSQLTSEVFIFVELLSSLCLFRSNSWHLITIINRLHFSRDWSLWAIVDASESCWSSWSSLFI